MDIKKLFRSIGRDTLMLLVLGGMLIYLSAEYFVVSFKPAVSFQDMLEGTKVKEGSHVAGDVVYSLGYFASETTYTKYKDGSRSGDRKNGNYYLIPTAEGFVGLKSRQADVAGLDKLSEETYNCIENGTEPATKVFMEGTVHAMESDVAKYYRECLQEQGLTDAEVEALGQPLVIKYVSFNAVRIMFALGIVLLLIMVLLIRVRYRREMRGSGLAKAEDLPSTPPSAQ